MTSAAYSPQWSVRLHGAPEPISIEPNPMFLRILAQLPADVRSSLSATQLAALADASRPPTPRHLVDYRVSLPWFGGRYYLTILFGKEKRDRARLLAEGQITVGRLSAAYLIAAILGALSLTAVAILLLYVTKEALGIDLFEGASILHELSRAS